MNISLRHIRALHAIRAQGSFARAAQELGVVPSALTETIRHFEAEAGAPLFDRSQRPPVPTPLNLAFLQETAPLLEGLDLALDRLRAGRDQTGGEAFHRLYAVGDFRSGRAGAGRDAAGAPRPAFAGS